DRGHDHLRIAGLLGLECGQPGDLAEHDHEGETEGGGQDGVDQGPPPAWPLEKCFGHPRHPSIPTLILVLASLTASVAWVWPRRASGRSPGSVAGSSPTCRSPP